MSQIDGKTKTVSPPHSHSLRGWGGGGCNHSDSSHNIGQLAVMKLASVGELLLSTRQFGLILVKKS